MCHCDPQARQSSELKLASIVENQGICCLPLVAEGEVGRANLIDLGLSSTLKPRRQGVDDYLSNID
jgi:hypothetical protein